MFVRREPQFRLSLGGCTRPQLLPATPIRPTTRRPFPPKRVDDALGAIISPSSPRKQKVNTMTKLTRRELLGLAMASSVHLARAPSLRAQQQVRDVHRQWLDLAARQQQQRREQ